MLGKRRQDTGLTPPEAAMAMSAVAAARQRWLARPGSRPPLPVGHSVMASPRACLTSAPRCDMGDTNTSTGATKDAWRVDGATDASVRARVMWAWAGETKDAWYDRASASPRASQRLGRCRICQDTAGNSADGKRGAGFARDDEPRDRKRDSEEVVPRLSATVGTDRTHDVLRDSGVAALASPGASCSDSGGGFSGTSHPYLRPQEGYRDW